MRTNIFFPNELLSDLVCKESEDDFIRSADFSKFEKVSKKLDLDGKINNKIIKKIYLFFSNVIFILKIKLTSRQQPPNVCVNVQVQIQVKVIKVLNAI